jgi:hypothetical protein
VASITLLNFSINNFMLSNLDLIREFVQNSIHKKEVLLSNPTLTAQTVYKTNQLILDFSKIIPVGIDKSGISRILLSSQRRGG